MGKTKLNLGNKVWTLRRCVSVRQITLTLLELAAHVRSWIVSSVRLLQFKCIIVRFFSLLATPTSPCNLFLFRKFLTEVFLPIVQDSSLHHCRRSPTLVISLLFRFSSWFVVSGGEILRCNGTWVMVWNRRGLENTWGVRISTKSLWRTEKRCLIWIS